MSVVAYGKLLTFPAGGVCRHLQHPQLCATSIGSKTMDHPSLLIQAQLKSINLLAFHISLKLI